MNPKFPLNGRIYIPRVLTTNVSQVNLSRLLSQSQPRFMFVTTLEIDNFDCTKMNAHFTACLWEGLIHEWKHNTLLVPPLPLMSVKNSRLCSTHNHCSALLALERSTNDTLRILVKPSPAPKAPGHGDLLGLAVTTRPGPTQGIILATVAFLLLLDTNLLSQAGITHYSQLHDTKV